MKVDVCHYAQGAGWSFEARLLRADFVLYFGSREAIADGTPLDALVDRYPGAEVVGCTTGGEIRGDDAYDGTIVAVAVELSSSRAKVAKCDVEGVAGSWATGRALGASLAGPDLRAVVLLSDGTRVNGSELLRGLREALAADVTVVGGLAGDGDRFEATAVGVGPRPSPGTCAALGLYGSALRVSTGTANGWEPFGPERVVTRSFENVLHELDGEPALDLYERYLGPEAALLPASALSYPLALRREEHGDGALVRAIIGVNEIDRTMTFAGDMPQGSIVRLMRGSIPSLVEGAGRAARVCTEARGAPRAGLALLVSCIGRKLAMGQHVTDEVEAVASLLGSPFPTIGFHSYGEISPPTPGALPELHNQSMTVMLLGEEP